MEPLFREEAYHARELPAEGETFIHLPLGARLLSVGSLLIIFIFMLFMVLGEYTSKARVMGYLEPEGGLLPIWSTHLGVVKEIYVSDGQSVKKGDPLFVIAAQQTSLSNEDTALAVLEHLFERKNQLVSSGDIEAALLQNEIAALQRAHQDNNALLQQNSLELDIVRQKVQSQDDIALRYATLSKQGFISTVEWQRAQHQLLDYQAEYAALQGRILNLSNAIARTGNDIEKRTLMGEKAQQDLRQQIIAIEQSIAEQQQKRASVIVAPDDGTVSTLHIYKNQTVVSNQRLASLIPRNATLKATLIVPSKSAGFVRAKQTVAIRYPAFPYQKFGIRHGVVTEVDQTLTIPGEQSLPASINEPVYLVSVTLDEQSITAYNQHYALKTGMGLEADIYLETRSLIEWLLEPILGFAQKV